jgi:DNA-binding beta-propeller fold protein YncE
MTHRKMIGPLALLVVGLAALAVSLTGDRRVPADEPTPAPKPAVDSEPDRSPVDLVLTADERLLLTANQTANTVSLVEVPTGRVLAELPTGQRPSAVALTPDNKTVLVSGTFSGEVRFYSLDGPTLKPAGEVMLRFEPRGIAIAPDGQRAYVALSASGEIAVLDIADRKLVGKIAVGRWPRYPAISPDGKTLAVGVSGSGGVAVVDLAEGKLRFVNDFLGLNLGHLHMASDNKHVYVPWTVYRHNPITPFNIRLGWVISSRVARVRLDENVRRHALSMDPPGKAVADLHAVALSPDEQTIVVSASGTHELLVLKNDQLPWKDFGGSDHLDEALQKDRSRFDRIAVGGRPLAVRYSRDGKHVYVANYLLNCVQVVDVPGRKLVRGIDLGGPREPSLARKGEAIFYDGQRSLDQWYSCHSCHYEGHLNAVAMDTRNDGSNGTFKTVLSLRHVTKTGPWTWHGWQKDLDFAMRKSLTDSMLGPRPTDEDVQALIAFLGTLGSPPNPYRNPDGTLTAAQKRGEAVFRSSKANCVKCHSGPFGTDGQIHNVGTGARNDVYKGYNTPTLVGVFDRVLLLHDGRARSLHDVLTGVHAPERVTDNGELTAQELSDLIEYLKAF